MKFQVGVLKSDARPIVPADSENALGELCNWTTETAGEVVEGALFMAYRGNHLTPEDEGETQPVKCGPYLLTLDGRLDNREEIALRLDLRNISSVSDSVIVAKACAAFGESVLADLIGEFALTLWCRTTKSLFFARSPCGTRPLYYVLTKGRLIWSTDFAHLVRVSACELKINESYVVEYLTAQPRAEDSPIEAIRPVPNGCVVRIDRDWVASCHKLWNPARISPLTYRTDREYEEHFRAKLTDAIRVRLRAKHRILSELSGGLDSSSLVLMADQILRADNRSTDNLRTVSCVYEESPTCDEQYFIRTVEEARGLRTIRVAERDQRGTLGLRDIEFTGLPSPLHCFPGKFETYTAIMQQHGARVLFTGSGGDHLLWSTADGAPIVADEMCRLSLLSMHKEARAWSRFTAVPYLRLLLGQAFPLAISSLWAGPSPYQVPLAPPWLRVRHQEPAAADRRRLVSPRSRLMPSMLGHISQVEALFAQLSAGYFNEYRDVYISHPYAHRPLVEFCLAVPISQFLRGGETKSLLRRAMRGVLPIKVLNRRSKGSVEETFARALQRDWDDVGDLSRWQIVERGYAEPQQLQRDFDHMRLGLQLPAFNLIRVCSMERWMRSLSLAHRSRAAEGAPIRQLKEIEVPG